MAKRGRPKLESGDYTVNKCYSIRGSLFDKVKEKIKQDNDTCFSKIISDAFKLYVNDNQ